MTRARRIGPLPSLSELSEFDLKREMADRLFWNGMITKADRAREKRDIAREERAARAAKQAEKAKGAERASRGRM